MMKNEILSAISVKLIKMVILGVGQDGGWYYVVLITVFLLVFNGFVMFPRVVLVLANFTNLLLSGIT